MIFLNDQLANISKCYILSSHLVCFTNKNELKSFKLDSLAEQWTQQVNTQTFIGEFGQELLFTYWQYKNIVFLSSSSGDIIANKEITFKPLTVINGKLYGSFLDKKEQGNSFSLKYLSQDFSVNTVFVSDDYAPIWVDSKFCICQKGYDLLKNCSIENGNELWRVNLKDLLDGEKLQLFGNMIHVGDMMYLSVVGKNCSGIFGIDKSSGSILNRTIKTGGEMYLSGGKIYTSSPYSVGIITLEDFSIENIDLSACLKKVNMNMPLNNSGIVYFNGYMCFASAENGSEIGVIDLKTQTLLWKYAIPKTSSNEDWVKELLMDSNKLYVLTASGKIYIFENTDNF